MKRSHGLLLIPVLAVALCGVFAAALTGCGSSEAAPPDPGATAAPTPAPSAPSPADTEEPPPDLHAASTQQADAYELSATAQEHYATGELSSFGISLQPRGEWHVNQEYPIHVQLAAEDGVTLPKVELERADAAEFGQNVARFDVPFTAAAAGSPRVAAHVSFAVCTDENCMFHDETVALALPVQ